MLRIKSLALAAIFFGTLFAAAPSIKAQENRLAMLTTGNNCIMPDGNRYLWVWKCTSGQPFQFNITNGYIHTSDGYCFDHGISQGTSVRGDGMYVRLIPCGNKNANRTSRQWYLGKTGQIQNALNWDVCLNIEAGKDREGGRLIVWPCGFGNPGSNEKFNFGASVPIENLRPRPPASNFSPRSEWDLYNRKLTAFERLKNHINAGGSATLGGYQMVAAGAGNMVAAGAGNMVAAGAGNILPTAGGNLVGLDGSTLRPSIGSLVGNDGASLINVRLN